MIQLQRILHYMLYVFVWPYYGTLVRYTIEPLERIAGPQKDLIELSECVQDLRVENLQSSNTLHLP